MSQSPDQYTDRSTDQPTDRSTESVDLILRTDGRTNERRINHSTLDEKFGLRNAHDPTSLIGSFGPQHDNIRTGQREGRPGPGGEVATPERATSNVSEGATS